MPADLDDLLPLFLEEAGSRLDRLGLLFMQAADDPGAAVQVRRELHALKGAARLLGLSDVADLCHQAEDFMVGEGSDGIEGARALTEQITEIVENHQGETLPESGGPASPVAEETRPSQPVIRGGSGELRVATEIVDQMAERSARMRIAARSGGVPVKRLFELASQADRAMGGDAPDKTLADLAASLRREALELETTTKNLHRLSEEQLETALRIQVQPLRPFLRTLARHTRQLAQSLGKEVMVTTSGGDVQLDRRILEAIREAALHLVHNAVDHGLEDSKSREAAGKNPEGRIHFGAEADGERVKLVVWDDGAGIDPAAVVRVAVEKGLVSSSAAAQLTADETYKLLELPGFTTRVLATDVSGRGIGLDAVAASFRSIGGDLWIRSDLGEGTRVTVEVPVARRGERVLVVRVGRLTLAMPSASIKSFSRLRSDDLITKDGRTLIHQGEHSIAVVPLAPLFGQPEPHHSTLVETTIGGMATGVVVDIIRGEEEVFVRPLPAVAGAPPSVEGMALLASGRPVAVLSLQRLGSLELGETASADRRGGAPSTVRVLLTDDTPATREMMRRLLEDAGFLVRAVDSAEEALKLIELEPFDCVITGLELPGLSGIDLTKRVRSSDLYSDLPVVVLSTRDRPADRLAGLEAGADAYLTKHGIEPSHLAAVIRRVTTDQS